jgi:hypothetical protein
MPRVTPAKFLGFFFGADWLARYLWLDTLGGVNERICVTERGKFTIAQRSARVDRGEGSSEFWALYLSQSDSVTLNFTGTRAGFSGALPEPIG